MNKFYFMLYLGLGFIGYSQVGVNTIFPTGVFHVDGGGDNPASSPTTGNLANDFWVDNRGNVGIGTTTLNANTRITIRPNTTDRNGIYFDFNSISPVISNTSHAIEISTDRHQVRGLFYTNSNDNNEVIYGFGSLLSGGNIVSSYSGYRNGSGLSFGLLTITGTTSAYSRTANTWALWSRGRAEISADSSPSDIAGVDLQIRNTTSGGSNPATIMMRQSTSLNTNNNILARLDFGDNRVTTPQARIEVARDADGGADDLPTRITFSTTPDASSTLTERMRISNNGNVGIGNIAGTRTLDVNGNLRVRTIAAAGTPSAVSPRIWAADSDGNLSTLTAAQVVSEGAGLSTVSVTAPLSGNGTVGSPISLPTKDILRAGFNANFGINNPSPGGNVNVIRYQNLNFNNNINSNSNYSTTTGVYTAPATGYYVISANYESDFNSGGSEPLAGIRILLSNNVIASSEARNSQYLPYIRSVSAIVYLTTSQEIRIQIGFPETWANFNNVLAARTFLTIHQL
jgi:hypothetical protein